MCSSMICFSCNIYIYTHNTCTSPLYRAVIFGVLSFSKGNDGVYTLRARLSLDLQYVFTVIFGNYICRTHFCLRKERKDGLKCVRDRFILYKIGDTIL